MSKSGEVRQRATEVMKLLPNRVALSYRDFEDLENVLFAALDTWHRQDVQFGVNSMIANRDAELSRQSQAHNEELKRHGIHRSV